MNLKAARTTTKLSNYKLYLNSVARLRKAHSGIWRKVSVRNLTMKTVTNTILVAKDNVFAPFPILKRLSYWNLILYLIIMARLRNAPSGTWQKPSKIKFTWKPYIEIQCNEG